MQPSQLKLNIIIILCCGLIISLGIFVLLKNWEESNRYKEFKYKAADHAAAIQTEFEHVEQSVAMVRFLIEHDINIEHDNPLDPDDFMPMAEQLIIDHPNLLSLAWAISNPSGLNILYHYCPVKVKVI